ncbi:hypothetical protein [Gloeobacter morelensis]|uniref:hypothetical protein n=1 Tax=Gloeobacter morelensis TaxID=2907343 RepID=UPI001E2B53E3|nr:hypothetical protein [Gloeobacter morelensis]UFP97173.1 hypothetical protein ISF26_23925 [Gloeobacter morelensis MG652769]
MEPEQINQFAIVHRWLGAPGTYCYGSRRSDAYGLNRNSKVHIVALQTLTHKRLRLQPGHSLCGLAPEKLEGIDFGGSWPLRLPQILCSACKKRSANFGLHRFPETAGILARPKPDPTTDGKIVSERDGLQSQDLPF